jgi:putative FmdB family regulatory protein
MPLYEYLCEDCERSFERLSSFAGADDVRCPQCDGSHTRRLLSVIGGLGGQSKSVDTGSLPMASGCACGGACSCN